MKISPQLLRANQTDTEKLLWSSLRNRKFAGLKFRRQTKIGKYIVDFVCFERKLIVELDGSLHNSDVRKLKDETRTKWLESEGFRVLRFWNNDVVSDLEEVLSRLRNFI